MGFPDINTIEPLADALKISVLELMNSERIVKEEFTSEEATGKPSGQTFALAITLLLFIVILLGLLFLAGVLGIWPVST